MKYTRAYLVAPRKFELMEVDEEPGEGEVLLKIASCGMCNWELNFWDGNMKIGDYPMKLGHEFAGEVVKVGPGVQRLKVGDRVSAIPDGLNFGGFAQYRVTKEKECQLLAEGIDPVYALGEPQKCVMTVLRATAAEPGDFGVVLGVGPMGMWCVQALAGKAPSSTIDRRAFCVRPKCSGGERRQKSPTQGFFDKLQRQVSLARIGPVSYHCLRARPHNSPSASSGKITL